MLMKNLFLNNYDTEKWLRKIQDFSTLFVERVKLTPCGFEDLVLRKPCTLIGNRSRRVSRLCFCVSCPLVVPVLSMRFSLTGWLFISNSARHRRRFHERIRKRTYLVRFCVSLFLSPSRSRGCSRMDSEHQLAQTRLSSRAIHLYARAERLSP